MDRVAVFVDAGYLFAQGSVALTGSQKPRASTVLDPASVIAALKEVAAEKASHARLLRIYWYDGAVGGSRPTADQALLAHLDDVKLRLGFINNSGQQKGVDSLIVTDLIELARQKSICDAVLLSGDEDVRVGVQIAQNYGVRVHLLGIQPSRGSQSHQLLQEADTTVEWSAATIGTFLAMRAMADESKHHQSKVAIAANKPAPAATGETGTSALEQAVSDFVQALEETDLDGIVAYWETDRGVPSDFDRKLLPCGREALGRDLEREEIRQVRSRFQMEVKARLAAR
ncbi:Uncharacterized conserved protein, LabA/DUF88 family [Mesorhizobium albiziae]|uniref:Uncharacterized conserved protein, LabA/DUF88 family n=1 Tax=Neomesorhizobium albiziae TaxID=335020 RepID=A0A1I4CJY9_9HYPH|nr:NYN domain-containing protein [Mesorhizobium albiziae]SFK81584.1 Uncharacterized conserved protein, LabA/DUF88 family [Mesorhizobium albiziae]